MNRKVMVMVLIARVAIVVWIVVAAGCAPTPPPATLPTVADSQAQKVFRTAERAFEDGRYAEALDLYNQFLRESEDSGFMEMTLFKIAKIYRFTGRSNDAIAVLLQLKQDFPKSALASDIEFEILTTLFESGNFEEVVTRGLAYTETTDPSLRRMPFFLLIADAYEGLGAYRDAARFYYRALNTASGPEKEAAWSKLEAVSSQLSVDGIQHLIVEFKDPEVMGLLLYRLGMAFILDENYDDALAVLETFITRFPDHPDVQDAADMVQSLMERSRFTPFTVGCLLPLSGPYAIFGQRALNGIELALSQSGGGEHGIPFRIVVADSRSDARATVAAVAQMDQEKVGAILGPMPMAEAAAKKAQALGIPILASTQKKGVPDLGTYVFRNFITPQMQVRSLVSFATEELNAKRFAILYPDEKYGWRYMHLFWDQVIAHGGTVNAVEAYDPAGTDFAKPIKKMAGLFYDIPSELNQESALGKIAEPVLLPPDQTRPDAAAITDPVERISGIPLDREAINDLGRRNPGRDDQWHPIVDFDAVFIPDAPKKAGLVIPQLAYYDIRDIVLMGTNLWNSKALLQMSGEFMKDTLITDAFFAESPSEQVQAFVASFQDAYGKVPGIIEALAYDSALMLLQTMRQAATDSRRDLKNALMQLEGFEGVSGPTGFSSNGEADKNLQMLRIKRGRFVQAQRTPDPDLGSSEVSPHPQP